MIKMILKKALILSLSLYAFNVAAQTLPGRDGLANQCYDLAEAVDQLVLSQHKKDCVDKLAAAADYIMSAGESIADDAYMDAKRELEDAIYNLQYSELNSCNRYIQISHSKFEAQRIKNSL
jgi:hypothetical protein